MIKLIKVNSEPQGKCFYCKEPVPAKLQDVCVECSERLFPNKGREESLEAGRTLWESQSFAQKIEWLRKWLNDDNISMSEKDCFQKELNMLLERKKYDYKSVREYRRRYYERS
ncbi:MAG: hypothetical protein WCO51_13100 [bacterium]